MMKMDEPYINTDLLEQIQRVRQLTLDEDISIEARNKEDARHYSQLYRLVSNYDESEKIVCIAAILAENSNLIHRVMEEERQSLRKKGKADE